MTQKESIVVNNLNEQFETLRELREFTDGTDSPELKQSLTELENTAAKEMLGIDLRGEPLDYDKIWRPSFPVITGSAPVGSAFRKH